MAKTREPKTKVNLPTIRFSDKDLGWAIFSILEHEGKRVAVAPYYHNRGKGVLHFQLSSDISSPESYQGLLPRKIKLHGFKVYEDIPIRNEYQANLFETMVKTFGEDKIPFQQRPNCSEFPKPKYA